MTPAEDFDHSDPRRYERGCRCTPCKAGRARYRKNLAYRRHSGDHNYRTASRTAPHIRALRLAGMNDTDILQITGISTDTFYRAALKTARITRNTERIILAVPIPKRTTKHVISHATTDATATWRRLQALAHAGWPATVLAQRIGCTSQNVTLLLRQTGGGKVQLRTEKQIEALYLELWQQRPEDHGVPGWIADRSRRYAASRNWHPAAAWDDIADPNEQPKYGGKVRRPTAIVEDTAELARLGLSRGVIAERLGVTWDYVTTAHAREGVPVPELAA